MPSMCCHPGAPRDCRLGDDITTSLSGGWKIGNTKWRLRKATIREIQNGLRLILKQRWQCCPLVFAALVCIYVYVQVSARPNQVQLLGGCYQLNPIKQAQLRLCRGLEKLAGSSPPPVLKQDTIFIFPAAVLPLSWLGC